MRHCTKDGGRSRWARLIPTLWPQRASIKADSGCFDDLAPAFDLLRQELGEIFGRALVGRQNLETEILQAFARGWIIERVTHGFVELTHDWIGRALRQKEGIPHRGLNARKTL